MVMMSPPAGDDLPFPGWVLRQKRRAAGLSQRQLAGKAGVSVGVIRDLEQGVTMRLRAKSIKRLAAALGVPPAEFGGVTKAPATAGARGKTIPGMASHLGPTARGRVPAPGRLRIRILGPLRVWRDGRSVTLGPPRQQAVLALLAADPGSVWHRNAITEALWDGDPPRTATAMIQTYVSRLRHTLDPGQQGLLRRAGSGYQLAVHGADIDALTFRKLAGQARKALDAGETAVACQIFEQALAVWRGEPLAGLDVLRSHPIVAALARQRADVIVAYAHAAAALGWHDRVLPYLYALAEHDPLDERACACLMIALLGSGQRAAALAAYDQTRRRLDEDLGVRPGAGLAYAHAQVLHDLVPEQIGGVPAREPRCGPRT